MFSKQGKINLIYFFSTFVFSAVAIVLINWFFDRILLQYTSVRSDSRFPGILFCALIPIIYIFYKYERISKTSEALAFEQVGFDLYLNEKLDSALQAYEIGKAGDQGQVRAYLNSAKRVPIVIYIFDRTVGSGKSRKTYYFLG